MCPELAFGGAGPPFVRHSVLHHCAAAGIEPLSLATRLAAVCHAVHADRLTWARHNRAWESAPRPLLRMAVIQALYGRLGLSSTSFDNPIPIRDGDDGAIIDGFGIRESKAMVFDP